MASAVAVLLSGGVDSSLALSLLSRRGLERLVAFYLKIWLEDELDFLGSCPWEEDLRYAREVCAAVGVPLEVVSLQREYHERVVSYTISELREGRTPSPDIFCNQRIKFGLFRERVGDEFPSVASGHYAIIRYAGDRVLLARSPDPVKDQTYFLSHQSREQLSRSVFPIGHLTKEEVRRLASLHRLPTAARPDSQGICFLGKISYPDFVKHYLGEREGAIVEERSGRVLGKHRGYWFHTIGQRQGLGLGNGPWYVSSKDVETNTVFVTHRTDDERRLATRFIVSRPSWINGPPTEGSYSVKVRHGPQISRCRLAAVAQSAAGDRYEITLDEPDGGLAPGQFAVLYDKDVCLGGAMIESIATGRSRER
jgi:tRNA (5-methylaminomethyl-2-thiouridylate)-methyltransferase